LGISRQQVAEALNDIRNSGRAWPPTAPEFRAMCLSAGKEKIPPMEVLYSELAALVKSGKSSYSGVSKYLYHLIRRNLDFYNYRNMTIDENLKMFQVAYKAMLFQFECGEQLDIEPEPETLLPKPDYKNYSPSEEEKKKASEIMSGLLAMFDEPQEPKPLTKQEIEDNLKLERLRNE
jgi:hypothetical protein